MRIFELTRLVGCCGMSLVRQNLGDDAGRKVVHKGETNSASKGSDVDRSGGDGVAFCAGWMVKDGRSFGD